MGRKGQKRARVEKSKQPLKFLLILLPIIPIRLSYYYTDSNDHNNFMETGRKSVGHHTRQELEQMGLDPAQVGRLAHAMWVAELWDRIDAQEGMESVKRRIATYRLRRRTFKAAVVAASAAAVICGAAMLFKRGATTQPLPVYAERTFVETPCAEIQLTTADGAEYILNDCNPQIEIEADGSIIKKEGGILKVISFPNVAMQHADATKPEAEMSEVSLRVPRGTEYQVVLDDSTKVWLSAESTLSFPTRFTDDTREVRISGEASFEVEHDPSRPFIVLCGDQSRIQVLGTIFNVSAYPEDRSIITTLLEGSVRQSFPGDRHVILCPSEQTRYFKDGGKLIVNKVDAEDYRAYREGKTVFRNRTLEEILVSLERTFDCRVEMSNRVASLRLVSFTVTVNKAEDVTIPLDKLKQTGAFAYEKTGKVIRLF